MYTVPICENQKIVVQALMKTLGDESGPDGKFYLRYLCPKPHCSKPVVKFVQNTGFRNPYRHYLSCYARKMYVTEQERNLSALYFDPHEAAQRNGGTVREFFKISFLSNYDKAVHYYLKLVLTQSLAISIVESKKFGAQSKYDVNLSLRRFTMFALKLVELVKYRISEELKGKK